MKTYSVKQIADMLETNPETIRRWIRDGKLKAIQMSRKKGNQVSEEELRRFLETSPKYLIKMSTGISGIFSPVFGAAAFAGGLVATAALAYYKELGNINTRIRAEDFKDFLLNRIAKLDSIKNQKEALVEQTQAEINEIETQIQQYQYLVTHNDALEEAIQAVEHVSRK